VTTSYSVEKVFTDKIKQTIHSPLRSENKTDYLQQWYYYLINCTRSSHRSAVYYTNTNIVETYNTANLFVFPLWDVRFFFSTFLPADLSKESSFTLMDIPVCKYNIIALRLTRRPKPNWNIFQRVGYRTFRNVWFWFDMSDPRRRYVPISVKLR